MPIVDLFAGAWTLDGALALVRDIQPSIKPFQYHVLLGGGVLNKGYSEKDLDLYFLPFGDTGTPVDLPRLKDYLSIRLGTPAPLGYTADVDHAYPPDPTYGENRFTYIVANKRIDVFIVAGTPVAA